VVERAGDPAMLPATLQFLIDTLMARKRRAVRKLAVALAYWMED